MGAVRGEELERGWDLDRWQFLRWVSGVISNACLLVGGLLIHFTRPICAASNKNKKISYSTFAHQRLVQFQILEFFRFQVTDFGAKLKEASFSSGDFSDGHTRQGNQKGAIQNQLPGLE